MQPIFAGLHQSLAIPAANTTASGQTGLAPAASRLNAEVAALVAATDAHSAAPIADASVIEEPALHADLIASLPPSPLEAFLPATRETPPELPVQSLWDTFGSLNAGPWRDTLRGGGGQTGGELIRHETLKHQALGGAREADSEVAIGPAAIAHNLAQRARETGLPDDEATRLEKILRDGRFAGDAELVTTLLETANAADALRTFLDLQLFRSKRPDRLTPDMMRALTLGVGSPRTAASEGREGILNKTSALAAAHALGSMPPAQYEAMRLLLAEAGSGFPNVPASPAVDAQTERALILKAVAARDNELSTGVSSTSAINASLEITRFAIHIRGMEAQHLIEITSPIDLDGDGVDEALQQNWQNASAPAVLQILRAEHDPIYAWSMHTVPVEPKPGQWFVDKVPVTNVADEQASMLENAGTEATLRGDDRFNGSGMVSATMANAVDPRSGKVYERVMIGQVSLAKALDDIESLLRAGRDIAVALSAAPGRRHALAITDVRGYGSQTEFLVTDPWTGRTEWVAPLDLATGHFGGALLTDYWR